MGKRVLFNIPGFLQSGPQLVAVTIGAEIKFSLKTRDANVAEFRRSVALAELNKTFAAIRQGSHRGGVGPAITALVDVRSRFDNNDTRVAEARERRLTVDAHQHVIKKKGRRGRRVAVAASREDTYLVSLDAGAIAL